MKKTNIFIISLVSIAFLGLTAGLIFSKFDGGTYATALTAVGVFFTAIWGAIAMNSRRSKGNTGE